MSDVGTKKLFENDRVIVWELTLEPGESSGRHAHRNDYFFHVTAGSRVETIDSDGVSMGEFDLESGSTHFLTRDGDELIYGDVRIPATHDAKNVGSKRYAEIIVELK